MKVTGSEIPAHPDTEWIHRCVSLLEECTTLTDEVKQRLIPSVEHGAYSQAAEEARIRSDGILGKWRALPRPQAPHFTEADRVFESALVDLLASFGELCAACDAVDEEKAEQHGKRAAALLGSYEEKFMRAAELLRRSELYPHNT